MVKIKLKSIVAALVMSVVTGFAFGISSASAAPASKSATTANVVSVKSKSGMNIAHNVVELNEEVYVVQLVVAGFEKSELSASVKDSVVTVSGTPEADQLANYKVKNYAKKNFRVTVVINAEAKVTKLSLADGILSVYVERPLAAEKKTKQLPIE